MIPFIFLIISFNAVGKAAMAMVEEVEDSSENSRNFRGTGQPEYDKCVAISTDVLSKMLCLVLSLLLRHY